MKRRVASLLAMSLLSLAAFHPAKPVAGVGAGRNWPSHGGDAQETGYSQLSQINTANVGKLGLAWRMDLPGELSLEGTPVAVDGALYFTGTRGVVRAVDGASGKLLWRFDPETWKVAPERLKFNFSANRGVAYANGRIFSASYDGRLFALDARSGKVLWTVQTTEDPRQVISGAPRVFKDKVIIGQAGADFGARGYVAAYDQATGKQAWRFYVAPGSPEQNRGDPAMEKAAATWSGEFWKTGTGGGPWDDITYDPELNQIYVGTANAAPYNPQLRSPGDGDNLYTASIVALDADTGKYAWHYQVNPRDAWDYDAVQQMTAAELIIDGKPRKVLMQAPKNGFFYVLDRITGKPISAGKIGKATWADHIDMTTGRPVEAKGIRYEGDGITIWPAMMGVHSWQTMAFSPQTGLVYVPIMQAAAHFSRGAPLEDEINFGGVSSGTVKKSDPKDGTGALVAWDPVRQAPAWRVDHTTMFNGGAMATAGGLVFQGAADGRLYAYDAMTGKRLWSFNVGMGVIAAPMTYEKGGRQYVAILAGYGGTAGGAFSPLMNVGWKANGPRRLLVFALGGKAALPASPARSLAVRALDDPSVRLDPVDVAAGKEISLYCIACHGLNLVSAGGPAPDLRESAIALTPDGLWSVVHDGALLPRGMPKFEELSRKQVEQLWSYIRHRARETRESAPQSQPKAPVPKH